MTSNVTEDMKVRERSPPGARHERESAEKPELSRRLVSAVGTSREPSSFHS